MGAYAERGGPGVAFCGTTPLTEAARGSYPNLELILVITQSQPLMTPGKELMSVIEYSDKRP